jgi:hypothetical protein
VAKVNSGLQQLFHGDFYCQVSSSKDSCFRQNVWKSDVLKNNLLPAACRP